MSEFLHQLEYWHWFVLAGILLILETMIPGSYLIWLGVGAAVAGVTAYLSLTASWQAQLVVFGVVSVASVYFWRRYQARYPEVDTHPHLNQRGRQYIGRRFSLNEPIVNGVGKIRVDDSIWKVSGEDLPAGTRVEVTDVDGTILHVRRVD